MLITVLGPKGSGKTALMALMALDSKREVYANFRLEIENYKPLEIMDFIDLPNNVDVMIDEAYTWIESRTSSFFLNRFLSYVLWQSRKRTIDIYLSAQRFRSLDLRFRDESDVLVKCKPRFNINKDDFHYNFYWVAENRQKKFTMLYKDMKKVFPLYDTYQIIEPYTKEQIEYKLLEADPKRRWGKAMEIGDIISADLDVKNTTHAILKARLMKYGYDGSYEPLIYVYLKGLVE